jgi:hypothetical protein
MRRWLRMLAVVAVTCVTAVSAQPREAGWGRTAADYDGRFTFVRLRWKTGSYGSGRSGPINNYWSHEFPRAERNLMTVLDDITLIDARTDGSLILSLDDPDLFRFPIVMLWEPGFWVMTDEDAARLREYFLKGGFVIFNDFELNQWGNFEAQMRRVLPDSRMVKLDGTHPIFDSFFRLKEIDSPNAANHHLAGFRPTYFGLFEDNDSSKRLMAIVNYNANLAEYWEWAGTGFFPIDSSNDAFKLGVNYMLYGLTH